MFFFSQKRTKYGCSTPLGPPGGSPFIRQKKASRMCLKFMCHFIKIFAQRGTSSPPSMRVITRYNKPLIRKHHEPQPHEENFASTCKKIKEKNFERIQSIILQYSKFSLNAASESPVRVLKKFFFCFFFFRKIIFLYKFFQMSFHYVSFFQMSLQ